MEQAALAAFPQLEGLIKLRERGWTFFPRVNEAGELFQVNGWRGWVEGYADAIVVRYVTDAAALRADHTGAIVWQRDGCLDDVVHGVLGLPVPGSPGAPHLALGSAPLLWTP